MRRTGTNTGRSVISRIILAVALIAAGLFAFLITAFYIFPLGFIEDQLKARLNENGILFSEESLTRRFPLGLRAKNIEIRNATTGRLILKLDEASAMVDLPELLSGSVRVDLKARLGDGSVTGDLTPGLKGLLLRLEAAGVEVKNIAAAGSSGLEADGALNGSLSLYMPTEGCPTGSARIRGAGLNGGDLKYMGLKFPVGTIEDAGLNAEFKDCRIVIEGLWLDAKEMSARIAGEVQIRAPFETSPIRMTIDLTQKGDPSGKEWMTALLSPYRKSANYYSIKVGGTVGSPIAER